MRALVGASVIGSLAGLALGAAYMGGSLARSMTVKDKAERLSVAAEANFSEAALQEAAGGLDRSALAIAQRHDRYTVAGSAFRDRAATGMAARLERKDEKRRADRRRPGLVRASADRLHRRPAVPDDRRARQRPRPRLPGPGRLLRGPRRRRRRHARRGPGGAEPRAPPGLPEIASAAWSTRAPRVASAASSRSSATARCAAARSRAPGAGPARSPPRPWAASSWPRSATPRTSIRQGCRPVGATTCCASSRSARTCSTASAAARRRRTRSATRRGPSTGFDTSRPVFASVAPTGSLRDARALQIVFGHRRPAPEQAPVEPAPRPPSSAVTAPTAAPAAPRPEAPKPAAPAAPAATETAPE